MSTHGLFGAMTRQERKAWLGLVIVLPVVVYLAWALFLDPVGRSGDVSRVAWRMAGYVSYVFLGAYYVLIRRLSAGLPVDERDHLIRAQAIGKGYLTLVIAIVLALGAVSAMDFGPVRAYVHSRSPQWVAVYLLLGAYVSVVVISAVRAAHYWRDRA